MEIQRNEVAIQAAKQERGWRVYATHQWPLNLAGVVWGDRGQHRWEDNWSRWKGQPLGRTPMYWPDEDRIQGLVRLLSLALRLLTVWEWTVREKLHKNDQKLKGL